MGRKFSGPCNLLACLEREVRRPSVLRSAVSSLDDEEFANFVRERSHVLARTAYLLTGDVTVAEDLLQTALVKVLGSWSALDDRSNCR